MRIIVLYCIAFILFFNACATKPDTCKEQKSWMLHIGFKKVKIVSTLKTIQDTTLRSFTSQYISESGVKLDTTLKNTSAGFHLSQHADTSIFAINVNGKMSSTLYVVYKRDRVFENYTCGFRTNFVLDTIYTSPQICDSIIIVQQNITDVYQENCRFYFNSDTTKTY